MSLQLNQKFPRGSGPLISILLPARGRPQQLRKSLDSLISLAYRPRDIEFLVKVDEDDVETLRTAEDIGRVMISMGIQFQLCVGPRGRGYYDIHLWLNEMIKISKGDWLFSWSDDVYMQTQGWDGFLISPNVGGNPVGLRDGIFMYMIANPARPQNHEFFALRREVFDVLGHVSLDCHADTWLGSVMKIIERSAFVDIQVHHDNDSMEDQTAKDRRQVTAMSMGLMCEPPLLRERLKDAMKLVDYIEAKQKEFVK